MRFATLRDEALDAVFVHLMMLHSLLDRNPLRESLLAKGFLHKYVQRNPVCENGLLVCLFVSLSIRKKELVLLLFCSDVF